METKLHSFLNSDLLNRYLVGDTTPSESSEVEYFIDTYPEVAAAYDKMQENLEIIAKLDAKKAPKGILNSVLKAVNETEDTKVITLVKEQKTSWYSIAASAAAVLFAVTSFMLYNENKALNDENQVVVEEIFDLRSDIQNNNTKLDNLSRQFMKLNDPDAKKYVINGNERAKNLKTVAYINPVEKTSMIDVVTLPKLPKEQYYQIWGELQDRMVNLGILDPSASNLQPIPYLEDALALSITVETKGRQSLGKDEVAEISLKDK
ncbi:MAG: anti-sigma factor [Winogradskyella sp.]|nr:anti-sigma factor [Winogradskyella sp.]MBT8376573.1 anti-sigma factor [Bacteroidia bacterium]NNC45291.1 anti-sigma factor [Winogradskyella sp.]NNF85523.1 anti-sigma factor [Winogradskyella sp.]NNK39147.1 anti-sigma factor [Winogradskyella sp.]